MNRPSRKLQTLESNLAAKLSRSSKGAGKKAKRQKKWIETHKATLSAAQATVSE